MLAAAAVTVSMAMRNPFADDLGHQDLEIDDHRHDYEQARLRVLLAHDLVSSTAAELHRLLIELDYEYRIQTTFARKCSEAYLEGYCSTAGVRVVGDLPGPRLPGLVAAARDWLGKNPLGTTAPPTLPFSAALARYHDTPALAQGDSASPGGDDSPGPPGLPGESPASGQHGTTIGKVNDVPVHQER